MDMGLSDDHWINVIKSKERWNKQQSAGSGGQGYGYIVKTIGDDDTLYFLKILKAQKDTERRARMFKEAAALSTLSHPSLAKFVESNSHNFRDNDFELYIVSEYISGPTLTDFVTSPLSLKKSLIITKSLAETIQLLHEQEIIHRDIKPDNIILREGKLSPVLVDFGMSFNFDKASNDTGDWQELGNRFLRLPELSAYSCNKRDFRTDITFLTGIFFFCLTAIIPSVLRDENGKLPHQRSGIQLPLDQLSSFFDKGFQPSLSDRFSSIEEFQSWLNMTSEKDSETNEDILAQRINSRFNEDSNEQMRKNTKTLQDAWTIVIGALTEASKMLNGNYVPTCSGDYSPNTDAPYRNMGLHHHYREHNMRYWLKTTCRFVGSEFVITVEEENGGECETLLRTDIRKPNFDNFNKKLLTTRLLKGIEKLSIDMNS